MIFSLNLLLHLRHEFDQTVKHHLKEMNWLKLFSIIRDELHSQPSVLFVYFILSEERARYFKGS